MIFVDKYFKFWVCCESAAVLDSWELWFKCRTWQVEFELPAKRFKQSLSRGGEALRHVELGLWHIMGRMLYKVMREGEIWASDSSSFLQIFWRMKSKKGVPCESWKHAWTDLRCQFERQVAVPAGEAFTLRRSEPALLIPWNLECQDHRIHIFLCKIPVPVKSVNLYKTYVQQNTSKTGISTFRRPWPWTAGDQEQEFGHLRKAAGHCATMRILRGHGGICFTRGLNHWVILSRTDTTSRVGCTSYCKATFPLPKFHEFWLWSNLPSKFLFEVS